MIVCNIPLRTPPFPPQVKGDEERLFVDKFLVKKSLGCTAFVKDLSMAKMNMPMDDQV
jgi:hypothetical protein